MSNSPVETASCEGARLSVEVVVRLVYDHRVLTAAGAGYIAILRHLHLITASNSITTAKLLEQGSIFVTNNSKGGK
jgi:hypothetical protein